MTIEKAFYQHLRQQGYWDYVHPLRGSDRNSSTLAWSNPNTSADPETMYKLIWLLCSSQRRKKLNPVDVRILDRSAAELAQDREILPAIKSYVKYLWEQVYTQESAVSVSRSESIYE